MPGACGAWELHAAIVNADAAPFGLWLAVIFQDASGTKRFGILASRSGTVHGPRPVASARTRATSAGVTKSPVLPKLVLTYDATDATQSSGLLPIGII